METARHREDLCGQQCEAHVAPQRPRTDRPWDGGLHPRQPGPRCSSRHHADRRQRRRCDRPDAGSRGRDRPARSAFEDREIAAGPAAGMDRGRASLLLRLPCHLRGRPARRVGATGSRGLVASLGLAEECRLAHIRNRNVTGRGAGRGPQTAGHLARSPGCARRRFPRVVCLVAAFRSPDERRILPVLARAAAQASNRAEGRTSRGEIEDHRRIRPGRPVRARQPPGMRDTMTGPHRHWTAALLLVLFVASCGRDRAGHVLDEASRAGRSAESFPGAGEDYFRAMDGGVALTPDEVKGRNTWIVWTGGNDRFWDAITVGSFGGFDLLKIVSSHSSLKFSRDNRWYYLGLVNEPCFEKATAPDPQRYGLWLDKRRPDCPADPFEDEKRYPGVAIGARGKNVPVGSFYGYASGIVGLRLFPNPDFDEAAARKWDPVRYYTDEAYYLRKDLVRPYRVGMSCAFCHVGPNPVKPPADPENPGFDNLSSNVGAQYFWVDRIFTWKADPSNYMFQLLHTARPGTLDTSLVSTDYINNPRSMNAVYALGPRLAIAKRWGKETLAGGELNNAQFNDYVKDGPLTEFFQRPDTVWTPHVLKDGSDSVGALGALNRVYLNIGLFSEEWLLHFKALTGGTPITPIEIAVARKNSAYWRATEAQTPSMALFFLKSANPHYLKDAPGGAAYLTRDAATLTRGKTVFAERCARCHSSKAPPAAPGLDPAGCAGPGYMSCWLKFWEWTKTDEYKQQMRAIVMADDFLADNFLSTDVRVPVTLLETNACSPLATNAIGGNIWDNFSSQSYKDLPSVGT